MAGTRLEVRTLPVAALALVLAVGCAHAPRPQGAASPTVLRSQPATGDAGFNDVVALAQVREWTVRAITVGGDTLVGRVSHPDRGRLRIRLRDFPVNQIAGLDRKEEVPGPSAGLQETRLLAGAAVGTMLGMVAGIAVMFRSDAPCNKCLAPFAIAGAVIGILAEAPQAARGTPVVWVPVWRRE